MKIKQNDPRAAMRRVYFTAVNVDDNAERLASASLGA